MRHTLKHKYMERLLRELKERVTSDNLNCNMNAINDFIEGTLTLRSKYSDARIKEFIDLTLKDLQDKKIPIDMIQVEKIRKKCKM